ncbi:MAG: hypothetical protein QMO91_08410 [Candidatus Tisiphia sp.]|nr:hypothetical protein [Candidatus Tisiphia sp.]
MYLLTNLFIRKKFMVGSSKKQCEEYGKLKAEDTKWFNETKAKLANEKSAKLEPLKTFPTIVNLGEFGAKSDGATSDDVTNFSSIDYTSNLAKKEYAEWRIENMKFFKAIKKGNLASFCGLEQEKLTLIEEIENDLAAKLSIRSLTNDGNVKCWGASSAVSSPVTTEPKVSSDVISNSDNKETDTTDTVSEITVVTEPVSDKEDSSIILSPLENADNTNEEVELVETEDESDNEDELYQFLNLI